MYPHFHIRYTPLFYDVEENYCRNPDKGSGGVWCYTTDSATRWEYCDLRSGCAGDPTTTTTHAPTTTTSQAPTTTTSQAPTTTTTHAPTTTTTHAPTTTTSQAPTTTTSQAPTTTTTGGCYIGSPLDYRGTQAKTQSGKTCQRWDSQYPHSHEFNPLYFPEYGLDENYCRTPDEDSEGTWCYTTDSATRWEYCDLTSGCAGDSTTTQASTTTTTTGGTGTGDGCYTGNPLDYRGILAKTQSGKTCQRWDSQHPHSHEYNPMDYPQSGLEENYCRTPDEDSVGVWCYTTDSAARWEYCDLSSGCAGGTTTPTTGGTGTGTGDGTCGVPAISPNRNRIVGGQDAKQGSWPWQVSMLLQGSHVCGGSIIAPNWIVTAAHCVDSNLSPSQWTIRVGSHRRQNTDSTQRDHAVSRVIMHERYTSLDVDNDIALMKLSSSITFDDYASPVCLPTVDVADGTECYATGWGSTGGIFGQLPNILQQGKVPVVSRSTCNSGSYYNGQITNNMICAGYTQGGIDSCQGDSGGPFVCEYSGQWTLDGVVSWGYGCAQAYKPGVYTRVTNYISWINDKLATY
ncbi:plasminogen-like [Branchiostoma floridae x Branchiostoma japonicum]